MSFTQFNNIVYDSVYFDDELENDFTIDYETYKSYIKLNSKHIEKINKILKDEFKSDVVNYDFTHFLNSKCQLTSSKTNKYEMLNNIKSRYNELYDTELSKVLGKFKTNCELFNLLFILTRNFVRDIENKKRCNIDILLSEYDLKRIDDLLPILFKDDIEEYNKVRKYLRWCEFNKNNLKWCDAHISKFFKTFEIEYLGKAVSLLQSVCRFNVSFKGDYGQSGYFLKIGDEKSLINFYSRLKFDSYGNYVKSLKVQHEVKENLNYYTNQGYDISFLTLSCKNLTNFENSDITGKQGYYKILKEFWRCKITKSFFYNKGVFMSDIYKQNKQHLGKTLNDIFQGSFGVLELKEKENMSINAHLHYLVLRDKRKDKGFIDVRIISNILKYCSNKFGNEKFKDSFHSYIKKVNIYDKDKNLGCAKYILNYLSKGLDVSSLSCRELFIDELKGVNLIRSSGLLHQSKIKQTYIENTIVNELTEFETFCDTFNQSYIEANNVIGIKFGGKYISQDRQHKPISLDINTFSMYKLFGYDNYKIKDLLLYDNNNKTQLYYDIKKSIWGSIPFYDKFSQLFFNKDIPLKFGGVKKLKHNCWFTNPLFIRDAFIDLGHSDLLEKFDNQFPNNIDDVLNIDNIKKDINNLVSCGYDNIKDLI